tara:strand:- start:2867 stop:3274 length:408 start_codon:yes stop_codon:yes gene_type:complete
MATITQQYDHPNYRISRDEMHSAVAAAGVIPTLTFRSRVAATVTGIGVVLGSISGTASLILTLLHNGSVAAVLTLSNSANEVAREFTLTVNRTLTSITDRFEVSGPTGATTGKVTVCYQYRIVPGATYSINAALT